MLMLFGGFGLFDMISTKYIPDGLILTKNVISNQVFNSEGWLNL